MRQRLIFIIVTMLFYCLSCELYPPEEEHCETICNTNTTVESQYDAGQNLIKEIQYNTQGDLVSYMIIEYNINELPVLKQIFDNTDDLLKYKTLEYDEYNNLIKETEFNYKDEINYYFIYEYNENNDIIKKSKYDSSDNQLNYTIYEYIEQLIYKYTHYEPPDTIKYYTIHEYNDNNLILTINVFTGDDVLDFTVYHFYNEQNLITKMETIASNGDSILTFDYVYNENNLIKASYFYQGADLYSILSYDYNQDGLELKREESLCSCIIPNQIIQVILQNFKLNY